MGGLAREFCSRAGATDPFAAQVVVVQHMGMGQWLKMQLAERYGIAANVRTALPAQFLWELYQGLVENARAHSESPFERGRLALRIMRLLKGKELAPAVSSYLAGGGADDLRRYQLSDRLAGLFDQYLMHRPDWMRAWRESGGGKSAGRSGAGQGGKASKEKPHEGWQRELWRRILEDLPPDERRLDRASLHEDAMAALRQRQVGEGALETGGAAAGGAGLAAGAPEGALESGGSPVVLREGEGSQVAPPDSGAGECDASQSAAQSAQTAARSSQWALPQRISVFGVSSMPRLQLEALQAVGKLTEVDLYFLNPCQHYWGDIVSPKDKVKRSIRKLRAETDADAALTDAAHPDGDESGAPTSEPRRALTDEDYLEVGNPILSSLGKQGREFRELLTELEGVNEIDCFESPEGKTALARVKQDILDLAFGGEFGTGLRPQPQPLPDALSLQLHICHSRLREVEVLRDQLLRLLAGDKKLELKDIVVMVPDIADYAPLVQTVFGDPLRYRISDRSHPEESPLSASFLQLLALPLSRFTAAEVLDLLESPAIARQFALDSADLELAAHWVNDLAIRWELDGEAKEKHWELPPTHSNTWRFGLDRLLLGFARSASEGVWEGVLPEDVSPQETELVGKLADVLDRLAHYRKALAGSRPLSDWRRLVGQLLDEFFAPWGDETLEVEGIGEALTQLAQAADAADSAKEKIGASLFRQLLAAKLGDVPKGAAFQSGGITFATLVPMRSIPFKVVCLLGMNDGDYPRDTPPLSFDLMAREHRKGDRSRKLDDRYLFLEALLSAQEVFYVSYVGRGARDNEPKPPSVIVAEWRAYLEAIFKGFAPVEHPLQPFSARLYKGDARQSFSPVWHRGRGSGIGEERPFIAKPLPADKALELASAAQLSHFLTHSARFFLQQRLGVYFEQDELALAEVEPFALDPLERYHFADGALAELVAGRGLEGWQAAQMASGLVMPDELGMTQLAPQVTLAKELHATVAGYLKGEPRELSGDWSDGKTSLHYHLRSIYFDTQLDYRAGAIRARHLLAAWVRHLLAGAAGEQLRTVCIGKGGGVAETLVLEPLAPKACGARLRELTDLYRQGVRKLLLLAPELCRAYAKGYAEAEEASIAQNGAKAKKDSKALDLAALDKAKAEWHGQGPGSERDDRYWSRLFTVPEALNDEFKTNARKVWLPLLDALAEPDDGWPDNTGQSE